MAAFGRGGEKVGEQRPKGEESRFTDAGTNSRRPNTSAAVSERVERRRAENNTTEQSAVALNRRIKGPVVYNLVASKYEKVYCK